MGFGRTARGPSFVYHAATAVDSVGGTCGSREGMMSWPHSWHTPCRAWYWCEATYLPAVFGGCGPINQKFVFPTILLD